MVTLLTKLFYPEPLTEELLERERNREKAEESINLYPVFSTINQQQLKVNEVNVFLPKHTASAAFEFRAVTYNDTNIFAAGSSINAIALIGRSVSTAPVILVTLEHEEECIEWKLSPEEDTTFYFKHLEPSLPLSEGAIFNIRPKTAVFPHNPVEFQVQLHATCPISEDGNCYIQQAGGLVSGQEGQDYT